MAVHDAPMSAPLPSAWARQLEREVLAVLSRVDIYELSPALRQAAATMKSMVVDLRLDVRDYEYAETRQDQAARCKAAREELDLLRQHILDLSVHGIFSAVEVIEISAHIDRLLEEIV